jgi:hypothetical protein
MILDPISLDRDFAMSELGDLVDVSFGMMYLLLLLWFVIVMTLISVGGRAVIIRYAHIDAAGMFARAAAVCGHATSPAFAVTGGCSIHELQSFILDAGI